MPHLYIQFSQQCNNSFQKKCIYYYVYYFFCFRFCLFKIILVPHAVRIIDFAARRGAFGGDELSQVGVVRDKFAKFLDSIPKDQKPAELQAAEDAANAAALAAANAAEKAATEAPAKKKGKK